MEGAEGEGKRRAAERESALRRERAPGRGKWARPRPLGRVAQAMWWRGGGVRARVVSHRWCLRVEFVRGRGACGAADGAVGRSRVGARHGRPGAGDGGRGMTDSSERAFVKV